MLSLDVATLLCSAEILPACLHLSTMGKSTQKKLDAKQKLSQGGGQKKKDKENQRPESKKDAGSKNDDGRRDKADGRRDKARVPLEPLENGEDVVARTTDQNYRPTLRSDKVQSNRSGRGSDDGVDKSSDSGISVDDSSSASSSGSSSGSDGEADDNWSYDEDDDDVVEEEPASSSSGKRKRDGAKEVTPSLSGKKGKMSGKTFNGGRESLVEAEGLIHDSLVLFPNTCL